MNHPTTEPNHPVTDIYLQARQVRRRYNDITSMTLHRWLTRPEMEFPKPLRINRFRYWSLRELEAWERRRAAGIKIATTA